MSQIGMNLRVTESCDQGGRKYMEDRYAVHFERNEQGVVEFGYFGVFDGHGGAEAAKFARDRLLEEITKYDEFWTDDDENVCQAIKAGFLDTHKAMWKERDKWPMTSSGFPSTSGTTASIAFIKNCKLYVGHVGDSAIVLGQRNSPNDAMTAVRLTKDHKPECPIERQRIEKSGGTVMRKAGVNRVVWNRPKNAHKGPVRRSTQIDQIPFLAVARSLGDLWSYDFKTEEFVVSPEPDVSVRHLFPRKDRCLILGSDGLWNMLTPEEACVTVQYMEKEVEKQIITDPNVQLNHWVNVSDRLVKLALHKWRVKMMRADNTSAMVVMIDPLGPSRWLQLRKKREEYMKKSSLNLSADTINANCSSAVFTPVSDSSTETDSEEPDRNASTPLINPDLSLPLTPTYASVVGEKDGSFAEPMDEDYDEVDGDMSIVSFSKLPSIGSEIVIDNSLSSNKFQNGVQIGNGELDDIEAAVMEENLQKNFKSPQNSKPKVPLLRSEPSFLTFSGTPPPCLTEGGGTVSNVSLTNIPSKLQKLQIKKLGGSPPKISVDNSPFKIRPFPAPNKSAFSGRPAVQIIREYLTNPVSLEKARPIKRPKSLLPGKPGDKVEIVREYLTKKKPEDSIAVHLPSKVTSVKPSDPPIISKTKKFNVTIIREYLMKKNPIKKHKAKAIVSGMTCSHSSFVGEVSIPSSSTSAQEKPGWSKWLKGRTNTRKHTAFLKGKRYVKSEVTPVKDGWNKAEEANPRQRSSSLTKLSVHQQNAKDLGTPRGDAELDRRRSNSLGNICFSQVLKIKNYNQNLLTSVKTRNSPQGFYCNCKDSFRNTNRKQLSVPEHSPLTGKEQINGSTPELRRRVLRQKTPATTGKTHMRSKSASNIRQNLSKTQFSSAKKTAVQTRSHSDSAGVPVRVLRSLIGLKRKAANQSPDPAKSKRMRQTVRSRNS